MMPVPFPRSPRRTQQPLSLLPIALLGLPLLLAGCADQPPQREVDWRKYLPKEQPKEVAKGKPAARAPGPMAAVPAAPPAPGAPAPSRLVGLSDAEVRTRLGAPAAERDVGPARVWTYRGRDCSVDLWLYYDTGRAGFYALEQELQGNAASAETCLAGAAPAPRGA